MRINLNVVAGIAIIVALVAMVLIGSRVGDPGLALLLHVGALLVAAAAGVSSLFFGKG